MKPSVKLISGSVLGLVGLIYLFAGVTDIDPGEVGLVVVKIGGDTGIKDAPLSTGVHWIDPFSNDVAVYNTRSVQYSVYNDDQSGVPASTKDGQPITADVSLEIGLDPLKVKQLHTNVGPSWFSNVVYPAARSAIRENTSQLLSDEIYTGEGRIKVQSGIENNLKTKLLPIGINIAVNLRDIEFSNKDFVATLENKAKAAQKVIIAEREAEAAVNTAKQMENLAEGEKQKRIKSAEANREELRLDGEGKRLQQEEEAKGILAIAKANAEGVRLQVNAYGDGKTYASVKWAENLGPNVKVYGIPTGSPGTSAVMDLNGILKGAFQGATK